MNTKRLRNQQAQLHAIVEQARNEARILLDAKGDTEAAQIARDTFNHANLIQSQGIKPNSAGEAHAFPLLRALRGGGVRMGRFIEGDTRLFLPAKGDSQLFDSLDYLLNVVDECKCGHLVALSNEDAA